MKKKRFAAAIASLAVVASMVTALPMGASAVGTSYSSALTTSDDLKTTTLDKYLVMKNSANTPNSSFTFTVSIPTGATAGQVYIPAAEGKLAVIAGVGTPKLQIGAGTAETDGNIDMAFTTADTPTAEANKASTDTAVFTTSDTSDEQFVKKTLTVDFSEVAFTEPGVYRYIITETGDNQGITNGYVDANTTETVRTLDVYVEDAGTTVASGADEGKPQLKIAGYVMYSGTVTEAPNKTVGTGKNATDTPNGAEVSDATKSDSITNVYASQDLTIGKEVTGNQGSKDKYFKFTVEIDKITAANTKLSVDVTNADSAVPAATSLNKATLADYASKSNAYELIADTTKTIAANGYSVTAVDEDNDDTTDYYTITAEYYLQNGQYITIKGLPKGSTYTVTEVAEDYTSKAANATDLNSGDGFSIGSINFKDKTSDTINNADVLTGFSNDRSGTIPTGILLTVAAPIIFCAVMFGGIALLIAKKLKKRTQED